MNLIEVSRAFQREAKQQEYTPGARVLFFTVMHELNDAFWAEELVFSERELMQMTQLPRTTLRDAKHYLTSRKMLSCRSTKRGTYWRLGDALLELIGVKVQPKLSEEIESEEIESKNLSTLHSPLFTLHSPLSTLNLSTSPLLSGVEMSTSAPLPIVEEIQLSPVTEFATVHDSSTSRPQAVHKPPTVENSNITRARALDKDTDTNFMGEDAREKIFFSWRDEMKIPLTPFLKSELDEMASTHGAAKVIMAINATSATRKFKTLADVWRYVRMTKDELLALTRGEKDENARGDNGRNDRQIRGTVRGRGRGCRNVGTDTSDNQSGREMGIRETAAETDDAETWGLPAVEHNYERYDESWADKYADCLTECAGFGTGEPSRQLQAADTCRTDSGESRSLQ